MILFGELQGISNEEAQTNGLELNLNINNQIKIISSSNHSIHIVLENGSAYSLGSNKHGDLGIGSIEFAKEFYRVKTDMFFTSVSCGEIFTVWTDKSNNIYISGKPFGDQPTLFPFEHVTAISAFGNTLSFANNKNIFLWPNFIDCKDPITIPLPSPATDISCGEGFAVVLCNNIAFKVDSTSSMIPLVNIRSQRVINVIKVVSSLDYIITLDENNDCWAYGNICSHQRNIKTTPIANDIINVFAMPTFCIFVNSNGFVYGFGDNSYGKIGDGTKKNRYILTETNLQNVRKAVGGLSFCVFLCDNFDSSLLSMKEEDFTAENLNCSYEKSEDIFQ